MGDRPTIFARASGPGTAGVAVYRVSGPRAGEVLDVFCGGRGEPRKARLTAVRDPSGEVLDQGLALWFPGPASFTGEHVAELHLHGSLAVDRALGAALASFGIEPATAGAFTMRAFANGKLDLPQAEGLADLLDAETEGQRRQALGQLGGRLSVVAGRWREQLLRVSALLAASVDFADEEDAPDDVWDEVGSIVRDVAEDMTNEIERAGRAMTVRSGVTVAITGPPNAGKSTLLNRLVGEDRAIVSPVAGTTRDVIQAVIELAGQRVTVLDTAGIREAADLIEAEGVRRAVRAVREADVTIQLADIAEASDRIGTVCVANKIDLFDGPVPTGWLGVSLATGEGVETLMARLEEAIGAEAGTGALTRSRHVELVSTTASRLKRLGERRLEAELAAEEVRLALDGVGELLGTIGTEEVLGEIFSSFCIGK